MKKLVITDRNGENPVTIIITPKSEEMLYELLGDIDRETSVIRDLFHLILTFQVLAAYVVENIQEQGAYPVSLPDPSGSSHWTLLKVFDFFNYLEFSA